MTGQSSGLPQSPSVVPEHLYHYTSADGLYGIVTQKEIWATFLHYLNDSAEFQYGLSLTRQLIFEQAKESEKPLNEILAQVRDSLARLGRINIAVFSLTEKGDLLSQWRGYCPNGGYSLGFAIASLISGLSAWRAVLSPCV